jgi:hypothetical protein
VCLSADVHEIKNGLDDVFSLFDFTGNDVVVRQWDSATIASDRHASSLSETQACNPFCEQQSQTEKTKHKTYSRSVKYFSIPCFKLASFINDNLLLATLICLHAESSL